ncbi:hypothetical protein [Pseudobacteriovorax antillogorgiicola]|uniref:Uncharacterized protein n=1 Tax=Pseudobacteriovorax antillogorgiicola TaxID=1513793 RepID=A0A1Y6CNM6_9BACT|nr:hypothetical protein [Pseudobacteriovorax antillogorgiicola]TCS44395.1 hypothetical protein EDD56_13322 [Pseudobacteriovorax antillogorgiicola]SMF79299.1 hypothetical protein SAMN06296036_13352 [Pseudobacteriovorax antillogorgiicola]
MDVRDSQFDTKLLVYRTRQIALALIIVIVTALFTFYIREGIAAGQSWLAIGFPLCIVSLAFILFPSTEEWEYKAWQSKAQKIEQQSSGK